MFVEVFQKFIWFLSKNKDTVFIFTKNFIEQHSHHFAPLFFLPFYNAFLSFRLSKAFYKELFQVTFSVFQRIEFFSFCKDQTTGNTKVQCLAECRWIRTSSQPRYMQSCITLTKGMNFLLTNSGCFSSSAAFSWSNWVQYC